jgi:hypothetical protein
MTSTTFGGVVHFPSFKALDYYKKTLLKLSQQPIRDVIIFRFYERRFAAPSW